MQICKYTCMGVPTGYKGFLVTKRDREKWEKEVSKAQAVLRKAGDSRARLLVSFMMNAFLFYTHPFAYDTKTYDPLREEVLMEILLHPGKTVFQLARHVCEERFAEKVSSQVVAEVHRQILNGRLLPKSPLCFHLKCNEEPRKPIRIYPTIFLAKYIQGIARGKLTEEQIVECARITNTNGVLLVMDDKGPYPGKWHYPCSIVAEKDEHEGDSIKRTVKRLFGADLRLERLCYERPSTQRIELGEMVWHKILDASLPEGFQFPVADSHLRWWTEEQIQDDVKTDAKHEIEELHALIELKIRSLVRTRLGSWRRKVRI